MSCEYCQKDPGNKPTGVWKGFRDADTGQLVCWKCRATHYRKKFADPQQPHHYSEMPVVNVPIQFTLQLR